VKLIMATAAIERVDPQGRTLTGANAARIKARKPDREYVFANPHDDLLGAPALEDSGWSYIIAGSDKETVVGGREIDGKKLAYRGQVLMWRPKAYQEAFLAEKAQFAKRHELAKQQPGGIDGITSVDGTKAQNINKE
jgi:hypothetical protein